MKKNDKVRLKKYGKIAGILLLGVVMGFSSAHLSMATPEPQSRAAEAPKFEISAPKAEKVQAAPQKKESKAKHVEKKKNKKKVAQLKSKKNKKNKSAKAKKLEKSRKNS